MSKQKYPNTTSLSKDGVAVRKGREHYSHDKADARKDKRSFEADARQLKYNDLSVKERIARAKSRRGESKRETARLEKLLAKKA